MLPEVAGRGQHFQQPRSQGFSLEGKSPGNEVAFSSPRSQFFTIRTDSKSVNNLFIFFQALKRKKTHGKKLTQALL